MADDERERPGDSEGGVAWSLAERFERARKMAKGGFTVEEIEADAKITREMAELIWSKAHPEELDPFGRLKRSVRS